MTHFDYIAGRENKCQFLGCDSVADYRLPRNSGGNCFCYAHALSVLHKDSDEARRKVEETEGRSHVHGGGWGAGIRMANAIDDEQCITALLRQIPEDFSRRRESARIKLVTLARTL